MSDQTRLKDQIARLQSEKSHAEQLNERLEADLRLAEDQCRRLEELNKISSDKIAKQDADINDLQKRIAALERDYQNLVSESQQNLKTKELEHQGLFNQYAVHL